MAAALKDQFGPDVPREIAHMIATAWPAFDGKAFVRDALKGYQPLTLTQRARQIAKALRQHLPPDYPQAIEVLMRSVDVPRRREARHSMGSFLYMPHTYFIADHGLAHFEESMAAQHLLTQRFTAEFSIRAFLEHHPERTLRQFAAWTKDPSPHVRRLVSEGSRPRLPWASRLRAFQLDPAPVLALLEELKDDPELYVRRSVANNLNDIGKDHPQLLEATARRWLDGATAERTWIVRHALRSAIKRAEPGALKALGFGGKAALRITRASVTPRQARIGGTVEIDCEVEGTGARATPLMVDLVVHYRKANGGSAAKIFKWKQLQLRRGERVQLQRRLALRQLTTRRHYPGRHRVQLQVNGQPFDLGEFDLRLV
jgi:3-methyladenine DNA glycosylase AlkC